MPSGNVHRYIRKKMGYSSKVDKIIDLPYLWLGPRHRVLFHTPYEAITIGAIIDGPRGALGGATHVALDRYLSKNKDMKVMMELLAVMKQPPQAGPGEIMVDMTMPKRRKIRMVTVERGERAKREHQPQPR